MIAEHKAACPGHVWRRVHCKNLYQISELEAAGDSAVNLLQCYRVTPPSTLPLAGPDSRPESQAGLRGLRGVGSGERTRREKSRRRCHHRSPRPPSRPGVGWPPHTPPACTWLIGLEVCFSAFARVFRSSIYSFGLVFRLLRACGSGGGVLR